MIEDSAHNRSAVPLAASLTQFTEKLIARRGVEQSNVLFGGQIGPATKALSARTNAIGVGDKAPHFSLPTAEGGMWSLGECLGQSEYGSLVVVFYRGTGVPIATYISADCLKFDRSCPTPKPP
jgi:hypothetical protein